MNTVEHAADLAIPATGGDLQPLERATGTRPVLGFWLAYAAVTLAAFAGGNMVTDLAPDEVPIEAPDGQLVGRSGSELLSLRQAALGG